MRHVLVGRDMLLGLSAIGVSIAGPGSAVAAFPDTDVKLYTGCLTAGGTISNVSEGDSPSQPCSSSKQVIKLSGGDITKILVTGALTGGGDNGAVTIGLDASKTVPTTCASGQVPKWDSASSTWVCGNDNDTQYNAGTGLNLASGSFSIAPPYRLPNFTDSNSGCNNGDTVIVKNGAWSCAPPPGAGPEVTVAYDGNFPGATNDAPQGYYNPIIEMVLDVGTYLVTFTGMAYDDLSPNDDEISVRCELGAPGDSSNGGFASLGEVDIGSEAAAYGPIGSISSQLIVQPSKITTYKVWCTSAVGGDSVTGVLTGSGLASWSNRNSELATAPPISSDGACAPSAAFRSGARKSLVGAVGLLRALGFASGLSV